MDNNYDIIIAGAGNSGLAAACECALAGMKTLLVEKHNIPGGCATSFKAGRFEFEAALHELCLVGTKENPSDIYEMFDRYGVDIDWVYDPYLFRTIVKGKDGYDITLPSGKEALINAIEKECPGSRESVEALFDLADKNEDSIKYLASVNNNPNKLKMIFKHAHFMKSSSYSLYEVEEALGIPQRARDLINTYWSYLGVPPKEINAMHYLSMLRGYTVCEPAMPRLRSHELSEGLLKAFERMGGTALFNSPVTQFLTDEDGKVCGVKINGGNGEQEFYAKEVISNIIPHSALTMIKPKHIPQLALKVANSRKIGYSAFTIYLGLDCPMEEIGDPDYSVFIADNRDPELHQKPGHFYVVNCLNRLIPDCSPKGTCMLFFTTLVFGKKLPKHLTPENYKRYKNEIAKVFIKDYEETMGVDISSHIEEIVIGSPVTFARYLGTPDGAIYGYYLSRWDSVLARTMHVDSDNPIKGLSYAGGHSYNGDGYSSAYSTGIQAAQKAIARIMEGEK